MKDQNHEWLSPAEACDLANVTPQTLRKWDRDGRVHCIRTGGNQRRYNRNELLTILGLKKFRDASKYTIGYCRVISSSQPDALARQETIVSAFCEQNGYAYRIIKDVASGLNYQRKGLMELLQAVVAGKVERIVVHYRDRLARFGVELIEQILSLYDVELVIINQTCDIANDQELAQDVLSLIAMASAHLYGDCNGQLQIIDNKTNTLFANHTSDIETVAAQQYVARHSIDLKSKNEV